MPVQPEASMSSIHLLLPLAGFLVVLQPAWADELEACASNAGTLLLGTVASRPRFAHGHDRRGVELSHTHVRLRGDDGQFYDIAIDDVFASGYDQAGERVPAPLSQFSPAIVSNFAASLMPAVAPAWTGSTPVAATSRRRTGRMAG